MTDALTVGREGRPEFDPDKDRSWEKLLMRAPGQPRRQLSSGEYFRRMIEAEDAAHGWHGLRLLEPGLRSA